MYKTRADGRNRWMNPWQIMDEATVDGWNQWKTNIQDDVQNKLLMDERDKGIHTTWCTKQLLMNETNDGQDLPYQMIYKTTVDVRDRWKNPYQRMHETTVDWWDQWKTNHTRWCTEQLLIDEKHEESIPNDVRNNCSWMRLMKDYPYQMMYRTSVDGWGRWRNPYQMMYQTTVDKWDQRRTTHTRCCIK